MKRAVGLASAIPLLVLTIRGCSLPLIDQMEINLFGAISSSSLPIIYRMKSCLSSIAKKVLGIGVLAWSTSKFRHFALMAVKNKLTQSGMVRKMWEKLPSSQIMCLP